MCFFYWEWSALFLTLLGPQSGIQPYSSHTASWQRSWHAQILQRWYHNFNMNFESCSFRQIKKIACGSSRNLSQMVKVDECQDTITTQLETCHLSKSGLSEAELILSRADHFDLTKDQVQQMVICPQHRHKLGKFWRPPRSCQYPSHIGPVKNIVTKGM